MQLNGFKYCYLSLIIPLNIIHLFTQLNGSQYAYVSLRNQLNISHQFTVKWSKFYFKQLD